MTRNTFTPRQAPGWAHGKSALTLLNCLCNTGLTRAAAMGGRGSRVGTAQLLAIRTHRYVVFASYKTQERRGFTGQKAKQNCIQPSKGKFSKGKFNVSALAFCTSNSINFAWSLTSLSYNTFFFFSPFSKHYFLYKATAKTTQGSLENPLYLIVNLLNFLPCQGDFPWDRYSPAKSYFLLLKSTLWRLRGLLDTQQLRTLYHRCGFS